jgi:phospholipid-translocating ATPase
MGREALDDIARRRRDTEANSEFYHLIGQHQPVRSRDLKVGDLIKIHKDQRVPADIMLLRTGDGTGEAFIRTDQLDGETDWKLRTALGVTQAGSDDDALLGNDFTLTAETPMRDIHKFNGKLLQSSTDQHFGVGIDNMMWANTVLASGPCIVGVVVYTGIETRQAQNTSKARVKFGLLESEINNLSKVTSYPGKRADVDFMYHYIGSQHTTRCAAYTGVYMVYFNITVLDPFFNHHSNQVCCDLNALLILVCA